MAISAASAGRTSTSSSELSKRTRRIRGIRELLKVLRKEYGDPQWWPGESPFEIAVGAVLTQRTSWQNAELAIANIKRRGMLSPAVLAKASMSDIEDMVKPSGFYRQKARYLRALSSHIVDRYGGDIERMQRRQESVLREELLGIPGIGPETADSILLYALGMPSFVVDAYTLRLLERLGMNPVHNYKVMKARFEEALRRNVKDLADMHALIVIHCKSQCAKGQRCGECCLVDRCPSNRE